MPCSPLIANRFCTGESFRNILFGRKRSRRTFALSALARKQIWVETCKKDVLTAALETGATTFVFQEANEHLIDDWKSIAKFDAVVVKFGGNLVCGKKKTGKIVSICDAPGLKAAESYAGTDGIFIMDAEDWQIIPAENLVAAFQGQPAVLFGLAKTAEDAKVLLKALEAGTDGVLLRTDDAAEVRELLQWMNLDEKTCARPLELLAADVTSLKQVGMGDRVAVDFCSLLTPGEGLLVGSYSQGLFLVHSECCESQYINSRPFRVNAGPVHAYVLMPGGRTAYLSELRSGDEVLVSDQNGRQRTAVVGRTKIERRPLVLVEADFGGQTYSTFLQNAETVRLVPYRNRTSQGGGSQSPAVSSENSEAISVTELQVGDCIAMHRLEGARHTGIAINESILER